MAASINEVRLLGSLGADPEIRRMQNGGAVANLRIATSERWKDKASGEWREKTEWHRVTVWAEGLVASIEKNLRKGDRVHIVGQIETRKWKDQQGQDKYSTEIVVRGPRSELKIESCKAWQKDRDFAMAAPPTQGSSAAPKTSARDDLDDAIPF